NILLLKYRPDGRRDENFGNDGVVIYGNSNPNDFYASKSIALDSRGNIYITGASIQNNNSDILLLKYTPGGEFIRNFGVVTYDSGGDDIATEIKIDSAGYIYIGGFTILSNNNRDILLLKYRPNGELDNSFNGSGVVTYHNTSEEATGIAIKEGYLYVGGHIFQNNKWNALLLRYYR
ncbi:MAG: hypothetical protein ACK4GJ_06255, partial [bacterium]